MVEGTYHYKLFSRNDFSAFWALFTDNLINLIVLAGICQFVFNMPADIVFGRILPGAAVAIMAGVAVYTMLAKRAAAEHGRDVTALPYGISTPVMFVYLFGVIGPIYWSTNDAMLAWQVGIGAGFMGGIVAALGAIIGPIFSESVIEVAEKVTIDRGVFLISPTASSKELSSLSDKGLVWRTISSDIYQASALVERQELQVRRSVGDADKSAEKQNRSRLQSFI